MQYIYQRGGDNISFASEIRKKLIVSCQAVDDEILNDSYVLQKIALACVQGGAEVLRLSQVEHIKAIKEVVKVPIIGLIKKHYENSEVFITPTLVEVKQLIALQVDVIALDATLRNRPRESLEEIVEYLRTNYPHQLIMADCSEISDIENAERLGFDFIGTTLRGYTSQTVGLGNLDNNYQFVKELKPVINKSHLIIEGGIWYPEQVKDLLNFDHVWAVVVGSAITRPQVITKHFMKILPKNEGE